MVRAPPTASSSSPRKKEGPALPSSTSPARSPPAKLIKEYDVMSPSQFRQFVDSNAIGTYNGQPFSRPAGQFEHRLAETDLPDRRQHGQQPECDRLDRQNPYRISGGYLNQEGIVKTDNLQRYSGSISLTPHFLDDALKVELNLHGAVLQSQFANSGAAISSAIYFDPTQPVHPSPPSAISTNGQHRPRRRHPEQTGAPQPGGPAGPV
jgi:hypothetical protein